MNHQSLKRFFPAFVALFSILTTFADIPSGYYSSLNGKSEASLKSAIHLLLYNHTKVSSYSDLPKYFQRTDVHKDITDKRGNPMWWDMYAEIPLYTPSFSGLNREHAFPKSWWGGDTSTPAYTDLNHLYPSEMKANTAKSNFPLGVCSSTSFDNGISKVGPPVTGQGGGAAKVFEPANEYKGDLARAYFYMVCCYQNLTWKYTYMVQQNTYPTLNSYAINLLLQWHRQDPPSQKEYDRNEEIYKIQNNRNPFIDYPDLAEYLWGNKKGQMFFENNAGTPSGKPNLITPVQDMALDFGQVAIGNSATANLLFRGENLTRSMTVKLYSGDKQMFSLPTSSISTSLINTANGYNLSVTYNPTELGEHQSSILVYDGGIEGSLTVKLLGECLPMPTLSVLKALPATDITDDSYVANWETSADEVVDYYIVTRTRYNNGNSSSEELLAESNSLEITDFDASQSESYTVQSVRLNQRSEPSNVIFVEHSGITGVEADMTLGTANIPGGIRFVCVESHYNVKVYDPMGRLVTSIPEVYPDMELMLPYGAYIIVTETQRQPLRVLVK